MTVLQARAISATGKRRPGGFWLVMEATTDEGLWFAGRTPGEGVYRTAGIAALCPCGCGNEIRVLFDKRGRYSEWPRPHRWNGKVTVGASVSGPPLKAPGCETRWSLIDGWWKEMK